MEVQRRAVIDVGTNSVKLLVADVCGGTVQPVSERSHQTRLGQGLYETHALLANAIEASARRVNEFAAEAQAQHAASIRVIATSAAREAKNAADLVNAVRERAGLDLEIISGEKEAQWAFRGVTTDPLYARESIALVEIGGGSTQLIIGKGEQVDYCGSFPLGTVRLLHQLPQSDPPLPSEMEECRDYVAAFLDREVRPGLEPALTSGRAMGALKMVATGGTATILARVEAKLEVYDRGRMEAVRIPFERMRWHRERLWSMPLEERKKVVGLPANRADVILLGAVLMETVMQRFGFQEFRISTRGLRFAALLR